MGESSKGDHIVVLKASRHSNKNISKRLACLWKECIMSWKITRRLDKILQHPSQAESAVLASKGSLASSAKWCPETYGVVCTRWQRFFNCQEKRSAELSKMVSAWSHKRCYDDIWFRKRKLKSGWTGLRKSCRTCAAPDTASSSIQMRRFSLWSHRWMFIMIGSCQLVLPASIRQSK